MVLMNIRVFSYKKMNTFLTKFFIFENINEINSKTISIFSKAQYLAKSSAHKQILTFIEFFT